MTRVRSLCHDDLPQVVALYRSHLAVPNLAGEDELRTAFEHVFLGEPLSDPSIPSSGVRGLRRRDPRFHRIAGASDAVRGAVRAPGLQQLPGRLTDGATVRSGWSATAEVPGRTAGPHHDRHRRECDREDVETPRRFPVPPRFDHLAASRTPRASGRRPQTLAPRQAAAAATGPAPVPTAGLRVLPIGQDRRDVRATGAHRGGVDAPAPDRPPPSRTSAIRPLAGVRRRAARPASSTRSAGPGRTGGS